MKKSKKSRRPVDATREDVTRLLIDPDFLGGLTLVEARPKELGDISIDRDFLRSMRHWS
jgi:hypothetical protein